MPTYEGIPEHINIEFVKEWVKVRVSTKRFKHICGVVEVGRTLAEKVGCDMFLLELAAWLHDACKELRDKELIEMAQMLGIAIATAEAKNGHLLHGPVAAGTARKELSITNKEVLDAISEHTLGAAPMSILSKVLYLADCLEKGRPQGYTQPIWEALDFEGQLNMDSAIVVACNLSLMHLIEAGKAIHPRSVEVRNYYLG